MLDADETASFDEAMRHDPELKQASREMDCLAATVAVVTSRPIAPAAGQLERLQLRLGLKPAKATNWLGISGWAAAAALTLLLVIDRSSTRRGRSGEISQFHPVGSKSAESAPTPPNPKTEIDEKQSIARQRDLETDASRVLNVADGKVVAKVEAKRLIQELEMLRGQLEDFKQRDRQRLESGAGIAWPVVMRMLPPGTLASEHGGLALAKDEPSLTAMLGDALAAASLTGPTTDAILSKNSRQSESTTTEPSAIPIYDVARKSGTLVVTHLPLTTADEVYNLWVTTEADPEPSYVGRVPNSDIQGTDSYDFSLGPKTSVPTGFLLTKNPQGKPAAPSPKNTILQGPN